MPERTVTFSVDVEFPAEQVERMTRDRLKILCVRALSDVPGASHVRIIDERYGERRIWDDDIAAIEAGKGVSDAEL